MKNTFYTLFWAPLALHVMGQSPPNPTTTITPSPLTYRFPPRAPWTSITLMNATVINSTTIYTVTAYQQQNITVTDAPSYYSYLNQFGPDERQNSSCISLDRSELSWCSITWTYTLNGSTFSLNTTRDQGWLGNGQSALAFMTADADGVLAQVPASTTPYVYPTPTSKVSVADHAFVKSNILVMLLAGVSVFFFSI
ncbi:hypothetical protein BT63DRAFT_469150 [Microthyrium microscopicum]|uniref:Uncharacterized protein n=1 Tax=Microthyrium microscopicum TaxID=703497 RepID=A0A6A6UII7_9PEZI|nr:hypothetical protein BT63DRAFT_469150 [Microthyrium microscopicum]